MSASGPHPPPTRGPGAVVRVLAVPIAVLLAGTGCVATVVSLATVPFPEVRLVVGEEEPGPGAAPQPAPGPSSPSAPEPEEDPATGEETEPGQQSVPPESYNGVSVVHGTFLVEVETAYTDTTITDGMGMSDTAPRGMEFHIYRLNVTNQGSAPEAFDTYGTTGLTTDGLEYTNDVDAEIVVAWDYFWDEINPGETVTTHILFLTPVGTEFSEVLIAGQSPLEPR